MCMNVSVAMVIMSVELFRHIEQRDCTRAQKIVMVN